MEKFEFSEPQGRLVIEVSCFLETDLSNEELGEVFNFIKYIYNEIEIKHPLIADIDIKPKTTA